MMLKITSAVSIAVIALTGIVLVNGHNDDQNEQQRTSGTGGVRRLTSLPNFSTTGNNNDNINRNWLGKYVANYQNERNPNHHKAMVEMLVRYGTAHVGKTLSMEDVKDALAIEFLAEVDGKPIPIAGSDDSLFIGTIGEWYFGWNAFIYYYLSCNCMSRDASSNLASSCYTFAGSAYNWEGLEEAGITHIVSAARSARLNFSDKIHYKRIAIADDNIKESPEQIMDMFLSTSKYIDNAISSGGKVLVHDWEGAGRSGVFIMAYLMRSRNISYDSALEVVRTTRSIAKPTPSFVEKLVLWEQLLGSNSGEEEASSETPASSDEERDENVKQIILQDKFLARSE